MAVMPYVSKVSGYCRLSERFSNMNNGEGWQIKNIAITNQPEQIEWDFLMAK